MIELTKLQKKVILLLSQSSLKDIFYWTGGTLLASYYFHHRLSYDLDFFSEKQFDFEQINGFMQNLKQQLNLKEVVHRRIYDRHEFLCKNEEELRIEFVWYNHDKKPLGKRAVYLGVYIDSLEDIAANKLLALVDRSEPKDLFDLYFIMKKGGLSAKKIVALASKKFGLIIPEDELWSRAHVILAKLNNLKPLLIQKASQQELLLKKIEIFFKENSRHFLRTNFKE